MTDDVAGETETGVTATIITKRTSAKNHRRLVLMKDLSVPKKIMKAVEVVLMNADRNEGGF